MSLDFSREVIQFNEMGYAVVKVFTPEQQSTIEEFAHDWVMGLLKSGAHGKTINQPLETYHHWWDKVPIDHDSLFRAPARHTVPEGAVRCALLNDAVFGFLSALGDFELWDEGLGWCAFRFIRPGMNDGYPASRKEWGPAKKVISLWIPVIGRTRLETLHFVPGSHIQEYAKYLPKNDKFCADEYRLKDTEKLEWQSLDLAEGEIIFTHPKLIHTEDVAASPVTRLNLEIRFNLVGG